MRLITRRSILRSSAGSIAAGALARPYIANAAATTATVWWTQGFIQSEDISFKKLAADYEKASGNKLDYSIIPFAPLRQKAVSAVTSGVENFERYHRSSAKIPLLPAGAFLSLQADYDQPCQLPGVFLAC